MGLSGRLYVRSRARLLSWDDGFIVLAMVSLTVASIIVCLSKSLPRADQSSSLTTSVPHYAGLGRHFGNLSGSEKREYFKVCKQKASNIRPWTHAPSAHLVLQHPLHYQLNLHQTRHPSPIPPPLRHAAIPRRSLVSSYPSRCRHRLGHRLLLPCAPLLPAHC